MPAETGDVTDVRAAGHGLPCKQALALAAAWTRGDRTHGLRAFDAEIEDFGGTWRVVLTHRGAGGNEKLLAFLHQP